MLFQDPRQHSIGQFNKIRADAKNIERLNTTELVYLLAQLATQGLPEFLPIHDYLWSRTQRADIKAFLRRCHDEWCGILDLPGFAQMLADTPLLNVAYALNKPYFEKGTQQPESLLVVFTTMFNNFYISNLALLALIRKIGVSVLVLKDPTVFNFLNGINGLGRDFQRSMARLVDFAKQNQVAKLVTLGYSSGGYAALLASVELKATGCLALAVHSDYSGASLLPQPRFMSDEVRAQIPQHWLVNLRDYLSLCNSGCERRLFFGEQSRKDSLHAQNLAGMKNVSVEKVENCGHAVVSPLFTSGRLEAELRALLH